MALSAAYGSRAWRKARVIDEPREKGRLDPRDPRSPAQRDRDRILYSPFFLRLSGVTQVVGTQERRQFHNRMTHSLKVAQVGRRIAETLIRSTHLSSRQEVGGLDPDTVEAACLAHDLGHPPFGHIAEQELNSLLEGTGLDGFEGNAQSFRIVSKLSFRKLNEPALNLTRATSNAIQKYPWIKGEHPADQYEGKWGAYKSERAPFQFARLGTPKALHQGRTLEARIMDLADDVTYAVHDLEDFFRAGLIPLDRLRGKSRETTKFIEATSEYISRKGQDPQRFEQAFDRVRASFPNDAYSGSQEDRIALHGWASAMIGYFTSLVDPAEEWSVPEDQLYEITALKRLTWHFVIESPALATLHQGQRVVIAALYDHLTTWADSAWNKRRQIARLPAGLQHLLLAAQDERGQEGYEPSVLVRRAVVDYIASLGEDQALDLHERLGGTRTPRALESWLQV